MRLRRRGGVGRSLGLGTRYLLLSDEGERPLQVTHPEDTGPPLPLLPPGERLELLLDTARGGGGGRGREGGEGRREGGRGGGGGGYTHKDGERRARVCTHTPTHPHTHKHTLSGSDSKIPFAQQQDSQG